MMLGYVHGTTKIWPIWNFEGGSRDNDDTGSVLLEDDEYIPEIGDILDNEALNKDLLV